jgi:hypothetical protein
MGRVHVGTPTDQNVAQFERRAFREHSLKARSNHDQQQQQKVDESVNGTENH